MPAETSTGLTYPNNVNFVNVDNSEIKSSDTDKFWANNVEAIDIRYGGQWGLLPRIGGIDNGNAIHEWMHEQAYQRMDLIPIVLQTPRMFNLFPNPTNWHEAVKALFEVHARTIDGLNSSLTVNTAEHTLGLSGASMKEVVKVVRETSSVSITVDEREGLPFETLLDVWIRYGLDDPDIGHPLITRIAEASKLPKHWTADWFSCTVLFIEPDRLRRRVNHAWLVSNLFPTSLPDIIGKKDKSADRELKQMTIDFGGFALPPTNKRVKQLAEQVLNNIQPWANDPEDILLPANKVLDGLTGIKDKDIYYEGVVMSTGGGEADSHSGGKQTGSTTTPATGGVTV